MPACDPHDGAVCGRGPILVERPVSIACDLHFFGDFVAVAVQLDKPPRPVRLLVAEEESRLRATACFALRGAQRRDAHHAALLPIGTVAAVGGAGHPCNGGLDDLPLQDVPKPADLRADVALVRDESRDPIFAARPQSIGLPSDVFALIRRSVVAAVVVAVLRDADRHVQTAAVADVPELARRRDPDGLLR